MLRKFLMFGLLLTVLAGCSSGGPSQVAGPSTLTDGSGRTVTLRLPVQRVVSLAPSNTEILFAVGAGAQIVGRDSFSDYPPEAKDAPDIGGGFAALNMELILSKKPDLVLASPLTPSEQIADLDKAGLPVYVLPNPRSFDDLYANLQTAGKLTGHEKEAAALSDSLKARVKVVTDKIAILSARPTVYYELDATDPNAPFTAGPDTFVELLISAAGAENFGHSLKGEWVQISVEELLSKQPHFIVLGDNTYGGVTPEQVKARPGWGALDAVKQDRIFIFDDNTVSRPGPRLVDGLEAMARLLHPEMFK